MTVELTESETFLPVDDLRDEEIFLQLNLTADADPAKQFVPAYHFDICLLDGAKIGKCDLRIGHNDKLYIGGNNIETVDIPEDNEMYAEGKRQVKVYRFNINA